MAKMNRCGAQLRDRGTDLPDLTCSQGAGHDGPVHRDGDHAWGDPALPEAAHGDDGGASAARKSK